MSYQVTYAIDSLDPNPIVETFESEWEAIEFLEEEIQRRIEFIVSHSPYTIDESELDEIRETEASLARIDRV